MSYYEFIHFWKENHRSRSWKSLILVPSFIRRTGKIVHFRPLRMSLPNNDGGSVECVHFCQARRRKPNLVHRHPRGIKYICRPRGKSTWSGSKVVHTFVRVTNLVIWLKINLTYGSIIGHANTTGMPLHFRWSDSHIWCPLLGKDMPGYCDFKHHAEETFCFWESGKVGGILW